MNSLNKKQYIIKGIKTFLTSLFFLFPILIFGQNELTQTIRGVATDRLSGKPIEFVSVGLSDLPNIGTTTNEDGKFVLKGVPIGRHTLQASFLGYETVIYSEILLNSVKEVSLDIEMIPTSMNLNKVVVTNVINKEQSSNKMALTGGRLLSMEEASRYAGGMDDPARLASSFAGVSPSVGNNGISVHGNAPSLLQWKMEGVEIPNPNHFADIATLGGGVLSSLSSNVLGNSDFYSGAFPAEYNNAISGVFDMKMRNGNNRNYEHTFQAGILGLDFFSEGPLSKNNGSSYIANYRYSTTGLMNKMSSGDNQDQLLDYQDLNFKLNFPTKSAGIFSVWGTGLIDKFKTEREDPSKWEFKDDSKYSEMKQTSLASGLSHRYIFNSGGVLRTTLATTYSKNEAFENYYSDKSDYTPHLNLDNKYTNLTLTSSFEKEYSKNHINRTGFTVTNMNYNMNLGLAPSIGKPLQTISEGKGNTNLISAYSSSLIKLHNTLSATVGVNAQVFTLNNSWAVEPRASLKWQASSKSSFSIAYGLHSRIEKLDVYYVRDKVSGNQLNKDLDFTKAHHISLSFNYKLSDDMNLKIEPYFQYLYDVPVMADSSYSVLNRTQFYVEDALVNLGKGRNYGVDITFEKYLTNGMYYMATASIFDSRYTGGDGVWHNTKFNRRYILNGLIGKEWTIGRQKRDRFGINLKLTLQGGDRYSPVDETASMANLDEDTKYNETRAFSNQFSPMLLVNYSISYRMNRTKVSHEFAIKGLNATNTKEYYGFDYNIKNNRIEANKEATSLFNILYRLDF